MAKVLQNGLRAAAFDEKYEDLNIEEEEQNQQENPKSNRNFLIFSKSQFSSTSWLVLKNMYVFEFRKFHFPN